MRCTVATCANSSGKAKKDGLKISFHSFPKDPKIRKEWIVKCKRDGAWNPDSCHVCSEHFSLEDFKRDLQAELLGYQPMRRLHPHAVPSLNLPSSCKALRPAAAKRRAKIEAKTLKEVHDTIIESILQDHISDGENIEMESPLPDYKYLYEKEKERAIDLERQIASLTGKIVELERDVTRLKDKNSESMQTEVEKALEKAMGTGWVK